MTNNYLKSVDFWKWWRTINHSTHKASSKCLPQRWYSLWYSHMHSRTNLMMIFPHTVLSTCEIQVLSLFSSSTSSALSPIWAKVSSTISPLFSFNSWWPYEWAKLDLPRHVREDVTEKNFWIKCFKEEDRCQSSLLKM